MEIIFNFGIKMKVKVLFLSIVFLLAACKSGDNPVQESDGTVYQGWDNIVHAALGIPVDADSTDDYIIARHQYILSYNNERGVANWVSWNQNADWYGDVERYGGKFKVDPMLPDNFKKVTHDDYTNSGFDRGHMVRSEDRTKTVEDNIATFYMTNVMPQTPDLNRGCWLDLEYYYEDLCKKQDKELYIIAGGIFHKDNYINGKVAIPDSTYKIIVVLDRGQGASDVTTSTEVIAVVMPNTDGIRSDDWQKYITTVDRIENSTGYDFLNRVPVDIQKVIESKLAN